MKYLLGLAIAAVSLTALACFPPPSAPSTDCTPLDYATWEYMNGKYLTWGIAEEQVPWNPDVVVRHFQGIEASGAHSFYEGPWIQMESIAGCVQLINPYYAGPR